MLSAHPPQHHFQLSHLLGSQHSEDSQSTLSNSTSVDMAGVHARLPEVQSPEQEALTQAQKEAEQARAAEEARLALEAHGAFTSVSILGQGSFGVVAKATDNRKTPPQEVAIKLLPRGQFVRTFRVYIKREILHQSSLRHPFVIAIKQVFLLPRHLAIMMEYAQGGNIFQYIVRQGQGARLAESHARWIFQQLVVGMDYCHRMGVANRDLKLENLLLDKYCGGNRRPLLKICDFGYSKHELNSPATTGVGTPIYMAPEIIYGSNRYDAKKADVWSMGIILYAMLYGRYPFDYQEADYAQRILSAQYPIPPEVPMSPEGVEILARLLTSDPTQRVDMEGVKEHPWFQRHLPPGALTMNDWYISSASILEEIAEQVNAIVEAAQHVVDTEPSMTVQLPTEPPRPPPSQH